MPFARQRPRVSPEVRVRRGATPRAGKASLFRRASPDPRACATVHTAIDGEGIAVPEQELDGPELLSTIRLEAIDGPACVNASGVELLEEPRGHRREACTSCRRPPR